MNEFDYGAFEIREDLADAHRLLWQHLRGPGTWWTGGQRVAIAAAARQAEDCDVCAARKSALSATAVQGEHRHTGTLPANVVDVIHRVRTDPARLSRAWFDAVIGGGLDVPPYVELIGVVTMITGVDYFARALGLPLFPLPQPLDGAPSRYLPASARPSSAWVPMIAPEDAAGPEADLYPFGAMVPNIMRTLSLVPAEVRMLHTLAAAHYLSIEQIGDPTARRSLDRMQTELVAARVSALNQCFY